MTEYSVQVSTDGSALWCGDMYSVIRWPHRERNIKAALRRLHERVQMQRAYEAKVEHAYRYTQRVLSDIEKGTR